MTKPDSKNLVKHISVLNVFFVALLIFAYLSIFLPLIKANTLILLPEEKKVAEHIVEIVPESTYPSASDYTLVGDENLFHPERRIPPEKKTDETPLPKPEFILYGTLISRDLQIAYLEDLKEPRTTRGRGKRQIPLKKGDVLSGFVLKEIVPEKVMMVRGEEKIVVKIHDQVYKKKSSVQVPPGKVASSPPLPSQPTNLPPPKSQMESVIFDYLQDKRKQ